ncbi:acyltransferase family protein [Aeromonas veronii]
MFGLLRTTLALMVVTYHILSTSMPLGTYAVFGFYMISGYLMTLVMHDVYGYTYKGRFSFLLNRFLRLYPIYWVSISLSLLLIVMLGQNNASEYHQALFIPTDFKKIIENIFMVYPYWFPNLEVPRLVPPTWAITVELFFYFLICLGISKTALRVACWVALSVIYVACTFLYDLSFEYRYFPVAAASLPFSLGSALFFIKGYMIKNMLPSSKILFFIFFLNSVLWTCAAMNDAALALSVGFYINIFIFFLLMHKITAHHDSIILNNSIDKKVGELSYPLYLLHWQCGLLVSYVFFGRSFHEFSYNGFLVYIATLVVVMVLSILCIKVVDTPIQQIRKAVRRFN